MSKCTASSPNSKTIRPKPRIFPDVKPPRNLGILFCYIYILSPEAILRTTACKNYRRVLRSIQYPQCNFVTDAALSEEGITLRDDTLHVAVIEKKSSQRQKRIRVVWFHLKRRVSDISPGTFTPDMPPTQIIKVTQTLILTLLTLTLLTLP